jgi:hypothetical protein
VDQGPLHWNPNSFQFVVSKDSAFNFQSLLTNSSPNQVNYSLTAPNSITVLSPLSGYLSAAGGQTNVGFKSVTMSPGNPQYDTIFASTMGFPPEKIYASFYTTTNITLAVDSTSRHVPATAGTTLIAVSSNVAWSVTAGAGWLNAAPHIGYDNGNITVSFDANTSASERVGTITVSGEGVPLTPVTITITQAGAFPATLQLSGVTVLNSEAVCYKALQTITAQDFIVENGGVVHMIAGNKITLVPNVHAKSGSAFHAWISATDICGGSLQPLAAAKEKPLQPVEDVKELSGPEKFFRVYPNPTTGEFTLELLESGESSNITVNIFGMQGNKIKSTELPARRHYTFNLSDSKPGIYLIQVIEKDRTGVMRMVKQ